MTQPSAPTPGQGPPGGRTGDPAAADASQERRAISKQLAKAWRGIEAMRVFFWTCAVAGALWALFASGWWSAAGAAFGAATALGALQVRRRPFLWSLVVAIVLTPIGVALVVFSDGDEATWVGLVMVVGSWVSVRTMLRAERLLQAHPDLFAARRITGAPRKAAVPRSDAS